MQGGVRPARGKLCHTVSRSAKETSVAKKSLPESEWCGAAICPGEFCKRLFGIAFDHDGSGAEFVLEPRVAALGDGTFVVTNGLCLLYTSDAADE